MRRHLDFYETNAEAVEALLARVGVDGTVLEPCNGLGAITRCLPGRVVTNDINPVVAADSHLDARTMVAPPATAWAITNPPFDTAFEILVNFHAQALRVALLLRLSFLEPTYERGEWLAEHPPSHLIVLPRYSFTQDGRTDSVTCAWMVWDPTTTTQSIEVVSKGPKE